MKMHHLSEEEVQAIMEKVQAVVDSGAFDPDKMEEIFTLSKVDGNKFLECKNNPMQSEQVNFEIEREKGIRYLDPFNFYTQGIYKDIDGWSEWTIDNLKEPWT